jgi:hypothetical protein
VLSISTCSGSLGKASRAIDVSWAARRLTALWSGTASSHLSNSTTDSISLSAWRTGSLNAARSIRQVSIALSE